MDSIIFPTYAVECYAIPSKVGWHQLVFQRLGGVGDESVPEEVAKITSSGDGTT